MRSSKGTCAALGLAVELVSWTASGELVIDTVAGGGPNEVHALSANLDLPWSVAVDAEGILFIAVASRDRVFKVDRSGQLSIVAGNGGVGGFDGDGGPAISASLYDPRGIALDAAGNVFIADSGNRRIRRVDAVTGIITTVAGGGPCCQIGDGGPATAAWFGNPSDIALDTAGNLFIADSQVFRVRRVDRETGIITTIAGGGPCCEIGEGGPATSATVVPTGVALDSTGNILVADYHYERIRRVDGVTGIITTIAGNGMPGFSGDGGLATSASLRDPLSLTLDGVGNVFIVDSGNYRLRRVDAASGIITTVAGNGIRDFSGDGGPATEAALYDPSGIAVDGAGNIFIGTRTFIDYMFSASKQRVRRIDGATGIITTVAGNGTRGFSGDGGSATNASLYDPVSVVLDADDNFFIADSGNFRIRRVDGTTGMITTFAGTPCFDGVIGCFAGDGGPAPNARFNQLADVALDAAGNLFIADQGNQRIRRVDAASGIISTIAGNGRRGFVGDGGSAVLARLNSPSSIAVDTAGNVFIADFDNYRIRRVDGVSGIITTIAGTGEQTFSGDGGPAVAASFYRANSIALDAAGNLFIADSGNRRIRRVDGTTGIIDTVAGGGLCCEIGDGGPASAAILGDLMDVAVDRAGNLFIAEINRQRIRRVDAVTGIITTIAGNGSFGFSGDGEIATSARLANPFGVALDAAGNLVIADSSNNRIRRVSEGATTRVDIDIKPHGTPNSINPTEQGVIPVAILGSESFDVSDIDGASLTFGAGEAVPAHDLGDPTVFADHLEDVNSDGIMDLVSHYRTEATGIAFGDTTACLSGSTLDGVQFSGCDSVRTVPDMDGDRLLDPDEERAGTNAFYRDSDNDGYDDGTEVLTMGTDPLDALDPAPAPVGQKTPNRLRNRRR